MEKNSLQKDWYEKILEKPLSYRRRLAFLLTGIIGFLIVSVWLFITAYQISLNVKEMREKTPSPYPLLENNSTTEKDKIPASLQEKK